MADRPPEPLRLFSRAYAAATGRAVKRMMDGPFHEYVDAGYVSWLEVELKSAQDALGIARKREKARR